MPAPPASIPPTSPAPAITGSATLTAADDGATVRLSRGQTVTVVLTPQFGFLSWYPPAATGAAVRRTSASGGYPDQTPARAIFLAVRPGTATLNATGDTGCLHTQPACGIPQQLWRVTVIVG